MNNENKNIYAAFVKAQSDMSNPKKGNNNPFFKSTYASLNDVREAVLPVLNENGIGVIQPIVNIDGKNFVKTSLIHESGEQIDSYTEITPGKQNDPQAFGSATSYARRYALQSFVCVGAEDDDAESSMNRQQPPAKSKTSQPASKQAPQQPKAMTPEQRTQILNLLKDPAQTDDTIKRVTSNLDTFDYEGALKTILFLKKQIAVKAEQDGKAKAQQA
jgi:hypothetical protein